MRIFDMGVPAREDAVYIDAGKSRLLEVGVSLRNLSAMGKGMVGSAGTGGTMGLVLESAEDLWESSSDCFFPLRLKKPRFLLAEDR